LVSTLPSVVVGRLDEVGRTTAREFAPPFGDQQSSFPVRQRKAVAHVATRQIYPVDDLG
jgi:hypothetical protein